MFARHLDTESEESHVIDSKGIKRSAREKLFRIFRSTAQFVSFGLSHPLFIARRKAAASILSPIVTVRSYLLSVIVLFHPSHRS